MMEKGSFHTSGNPDQEFLPSPSERLDEVVRGIPLPNQLPPGVNFRDLPPSALKSATLETLISQNEDLMARLSVTLRKSSQLEEKTAVLERENKNIKAKFETLHEQFQILQEKDKIFSNRSQKLLEENGQAREHQQKLEKVYSELYVQALAFQRRLQFLERYRVRIKKASRAVQARAKGFTAATEELEQTRKTLSISHMQTVNAYEAKLADCKQQIDALRDKAAERDQLFDENVRLQNQLVFEQRQHALVREDSTRTIDRLEGEASALRLELKHSLIAEGAQRVQLSQLSSEMPALREHNKALAEQVESLQALWGHKQREFEQLEEKNRALQKLNQSLSVTLNQQRKDIQTLQSEMDAERFAASDRIKILTSEIEMLRAQTKEV